MIPKQTWSVIHAIVLCRSKYWWRAQSLSCFFCSLRDGVSRRLTSVRLACRDTEAYIYLHEPCNRCNRMQHV